MFLCTQNHETTTMLCLGPYYLYSAPNPSSKGRQIPSDWLYGHPSAFGGNGRSRTCLSSLIRRVPDRSDTVPCFWCRSRVSNPLEPNDNGFTVRPASLTDYTGILRPGLRTYHTLRLSSSYRTIQRVKVPCKTWTAIRDSNSPFLLGRQTC